MPYDHIAIEGVIGAGKSTLSRMISELTDCTFIPENFENNPHLETFYASGTKALQNELYFLKSRTELLNNLPLTKKVLDFSYLKGLVFAKENLSDNDFAHYQHDYNKLKQDSFMPDLMLYIDQDISTLRQQIISRGRVMEKYISSDYLNNIKISYNHYLNTKQPFPILVLDGKILKLSPPDQILSHLNKLLIERNFSPLTPKKQS